MCARPRPAHRANGHDDTRGAHGRRNFASDPLPDHRTDTARLESKRAMTDSRSGTKFARNLRVDGSACLREGKFRLLALSECEMTKTLDYLAMLAALAAIGAVCVG